MSKDLVKIIRNEPLADSRLIAERLGIEHRSFFRLILKYQDQIEGFGLLRFKIASVKTKGQRGTNHQRYVGEGADVSLTPEKIMEISGLQRDEWPEGETSEAVARALEAVKGGGK